MSINLIALADTAETLFQDHQQEILQIRVIEHASGNKSSIGSGFFIRDDGLIATNYHVVSLYVHNPERYNLEYVDQDGSTGKLTIVDFDVIHDLALTKAIDKNTTPFFQLSKSSLAKGARIYSLGNPHDLGMSIIEGTYNGLLEQSLYDKIFFSGSLNPGMSGGPAIDEQGKVIGINVSTAGNQLSFLVPVNYLVELINDSKTHSLAITEFASRIEAQLVAHQKTYLTTLLESEWPMSQFGPLLLPEKIANIFKCWGDTDNVKKSLVEHSFSHCISEDRIFLTTRYTTGGIAYSYDLYKNKASSSMHFYNIYDNFFGRVNRVNIAKREDVTNYRCQTDFVTLTDRDWKIAYCARKHNKFTSIYDISLVMALNSEFDQGMIIQLIISGVSKPIAMKFVKKFAGSIQWQ